MRRRILLFICLTLSLAVGFIPISAQAVEETLPIQQSEETQVTSDLADNPQLQQAYSVSVGQDNPAYHVQQMADNYSIHNPNYGYDADFLVNGVNIRAGNDTWQMELLSYGYGTHQESVASAVVSTANNKITYARGNLSEWYINSPLGLQQGFTLQIAPQNVQSGELTLALNLSGTMQATLHNNTLNLTGEHGATLNYTGLYAFDANGQTLPANLRLENNQLFIEVDDSQAIYPVTIDPWVQQQKIWGTDEQSFDFFGMAVDIEGDIAVVGANSDRPIGGFTDEGSASVFTRSGGVWSFQQKLTSSSPEQSLRFGGSVGLSGNTIVVNAPDADCTGVPNSSCGRAYVFVWDGNSWVEQAELAGSDSVNGDKFGEYVAIDGDTIAIALRSPKKIYIFDRTGAIWTETTILNVGNPIGAQVFSQLKLDGDTIIIGDEYHDDHGSNSGAAWVYFRTGTSWALQDELEVTPTLQAGDSFGYSVDVQGDVAVVGALGDDDEGSNHGALYVFQRTGSVWNQETKLTATNILTTGQSSLGISVAIDDNIIAGGASGDDSAIAGGGAVNIFVNLSGTWYETSELHPFSGMVSGEAMGGAVAIDNGTVIAGARYATGGIANVGAAYLFNLEPGVTLLDDSVAVTEGGTTATVDLILDTAPTADVTVNLAYSNGSPYGAEVTSPAPPITFPSGTQGPLTLTIEAIDDTLYEGPHSDTITISVTSADPDYNGVSVLFGGGGGVNNDEIAVDITDNEGTPDITIDDPTVTEGASGSFTFSISPQINADTDVIFTVTDGSATSGTDYTVTTTSPVTIPTGASSVTVDFTTVDDGFYEINEDFVVDLTGATNVLVSPTISDNQGTGTINNDEAIPDITIDDPSETEGTGGSFTVSINPPVATDTDVNFTVTDGSATGSGTDYTVTSSSPVTIPAEVSSITIDFTTVDDSVYEGDEDFVVDLTGSTNAIVVPTLSDDQGTGTVLENEPIPNFSISPSSVVHAEGNVGTTAYEFTVTLSGAAAIPVTVDYTTNDDTATTADSDYDDNDNILTFNPGGSLTQTVTVNSNGDEQFETDEDFTVTLNSSTIATIDGANDTATGTITNDDNVPEISISPASVVHDEGNAGTTAYEFTVTLSGAAAIPVTVDYTTNDDIATTADSDYVDNDDTLTFNPGDSLTQTITVLANGDTQFEANEDFTVTLNSSTIATIDGANDTATGTITNDDSQPPPDNDLFVNATPVFVDLGTTGFFQSTLNATVSPSDPDLWCAPEYTNSVWFSITAQEEQLVTIDTTDSEYDTIVAFFTGTEGNLNVVACNDDHPSGGTPISVASIHALPTQTYYLMIAKKGTTPVQSGFDQLSVNLTGESNNNDALALFDPSDADTTLFDRVHDTPSWDLSYTNTPPTNTAPEWVMGDWNGDGVRTPGYFDSGAFRYTNDIGPSTNWSAGFWLGNPPSRGDVVTGRFNSGFPNDNGNDCIGWVDSNTNGAGDLRFSLKYWCDMTTTPQSIGGTLATQWLAAVLSDSQGFSGTHQWVYGDWDNDNLDEPGVRRGEFITRSTNAPSEGAALYGAGMAQRWAGTGGGIGPGGHGLDDGVFVAGDWNGDGTDTWGVVYDDDIFYYRDVFGFNPGPFEFASQTFTSSISAPRQVVSHHNASGSSSSPAPASPLVLRDDEINSAGINPADVDTSRNVEADLSVSKAGNYTLGEVGLVGDSIVWTITVSNTGTAPAHGVQITDNVPSELRVDDALSDNGTITVRGQSVTFTAESIGVGETIQFQVVTTILSQPSSGTFANSVNVVVPDGNGGGSDANLVASGTVESVDGLPSTGYRPQLRW